MSTVSQILHEKGSQVFSIGKDVTVLDAAQKMNEQTVGALVVIEQAAVVGIFTERDVLQRIVAQHRAPENTRVVDVMTSPVACCRPETTIDEARAVMKNRRFVTYPWSTNSSNCWA